MAAGRVLRWSSRGTFGVAALACVLVLYGASATRAAAAETVFNFDTLTETTLVTTQYEGQGLKLGFAGEFGQSSPEAKKEGNCGPPEVTKEAPGKPAASKPNYATLPECPPGAALFAGTYGALAHPATALSVEVSNVTSGPNTVAKLIAYNSSGTEVASAKAEASAGTWRRISVAPGGAARISFFMIRSEPSGSPLTIGIDNLAVEVPSETPPTETGSAPPPPAPTPPTASGALVTPNPGPGQLLAISGGGSQPGSGHIISYDWDLNGDGKIDTSTGTNPIVHLVLAPGPHTIGLTVTNSKGEKASSKFGVSVPTGISLPPPADGGEGPCEPTLEVGDAQIIAECIQKLAGGGYAIESRQLGLNGMVLEPQGGGYGVFKIHTVKDIAIDGTQTLLSGSAVDLELLNTPIGDVVLGGRDLESEPVQLDAQSALNKLQIPVLNHGLRGAHAHAADAPTKTLLMAIGVGKPCSGKEKGAACCPPAQGNTACATLPGNFPIVGQVDVYLNNKGQALFDVQVGLALKGIFEATGALEIEADPQSGVNLNSLQFTIPEAGLEGIFTVKKAKFAYYFPSAPEESKRDTWQAEGEIVFGPLGEPALEAELAFRKGQFHSGSLVFVAPPPGIPIYPGVFLNKLGGSIGVEPFTFGGELGAKVADTLQLNLLFKYREQEGKELGFLGGEGQLELDDDKIATLAADVYSDGYIDASLNIDLHLPFSSENPVVKVGGHIGFWDEPSSGRWQAEGSVYIKLWEISAEVAGLVNNTYIAGCLAWNGAGLQGRYRFSDGNVDGGFFAFSNCSDQLKQYKETPLTKHAGGFVKEESLRVSPFEVTAAGKGAGLLGSNGAAGLLGTAASVEGDTFTLPSGQFAQELRLTSSSGTPVVKLIAPGGQIYTTPAAAGQLLSSAGQFYSAVAPEHNQVLVLLKHPQGGTWRVQSAAGSPPLQKLEVAADAPPARVQVKVRHGRGSRWSLRYKIGNYVPGTSVLLVERGKDSTHVLGIARSASGTLSFLPQDAISRSRRIVAYLLNSEGAPQRALTVGHYTAPGAQRGGRVPGVRIVRKGLTALVSWPRASNARLYRVLVHGSDGRVQTFLRKPNGRSVQLENVLPFESFTATVTANGGPNLLAGPPTTGRLLPVKTKTPRPAAKHKAHKHK